MNGFLLMALQFTPWLQHLEAEAMRITMAMLKMETSKQFFATLFAIAVLPAVCEEWLFRGAIQPIFAKWSGEYTHRDLGLVLFFLARYTFNSSGFYPVLLLGAGFGYMVVASGSLWPRCIGTLCK